MQVQELLGARVGRDLEFYSISLDPDFDTPAALSAYAASFGVGPGWTFLSGAQGDVTALRHALGAFDPDPEVDADLTQHAGILIYGDEPKGRWCALPGELRASALVRALERILAI